MSFKKKKFSYKKKIIKNILRKRNTPGFLSGQGLSILPLHERYMQIVQGSASGRCWKYSFAFVREQSKEKKLTQNHNAA